MSIIEKEKKPISQGEAGPYPEKRKIREVSEHFSKKTSRSGGGEVVGGDILSCSEGVSKSQKRLLGERSKVRRGGFQQAKQIKKPEKEGPKYLPRKKDVTDSPENQIKGRFCLRLKGCLLEKKTKEPFLPWAEAYGKRVRHCNHFARCFGKGAGEIFY